MSKKHPRRQNRPAAAPEPTGRIVRRVRDVDDVDRPEPLTDAEAARWLLDVIRAQRTHGTIGATHVLRACPRPGDVLLMAVRAYALQHEEHFPRELHVLFKLLNLVFFEATCQVKVQPQGPATLA